jgi:hypothetical protein
MGSSEVNSPAAGALKPLRGGCRTTSSRLGGLHLSCIVLDIYIVHRTFKAFFMGLSRRAWRLI